MQAHIVADRDFAVDPVLGDREIGVMTSVTTRPESDRMSSTVSKLAIDQPPSRVPVSGAAD
jgi:hypothetical protein